MKILGNRVLVSRIEEEKKDGEFETVNVTDSFLYKGKVEKISDEMYQSNIVVGDTVIFAKYSPDTQDVEYDGIKYKAVMYSDIIAVL